MTALDQNTIVVAGEALIDLTPRPDGALTPHIGGGPFNTALALARLEQPTSFVGCVSRDRFGRDIAERLANEGVVVDERLRTEQPTTLAIAELDESGAAAYRFHLAGTSAFQLTPDLALGALPERIAALHVGSLALALDPTSAAIAALVAAVRGRAPVMVDPNVRPAAIGDLDAYRDRLAPLLAMSDILKVSDADLNLLAPETSPIEAAGRLLEQGPRLVLLTLGAKGAVALGAFGVLEITAPPVTVIDTIGAGDIFSAAWIGHWLSSGAGLDDAASVALATAFACRAASLSCTRPGASPPRASELEAGAASFY